MWHRLNDSGVREASHDGSANTTLCWRIFVVDSDCFCGRCFPEYGTDSGRCYFSELHQLAGQRYLLLAALLLVGAFDLRED